MEALLSERGARVVDSCSNKSITLLIVPRKSLPEYREGVSRNLAMRSPFWVQQCVAEDVLIESDKPVYFPHAATLPLSNLKNEEISVSNFLDREREELKEMIRLLGATFTGFFSRSHLALVCKTPEGEKYAAAKRWKVPVVSAEWLEEAFTKGTWVHLDMRRFSLLPGAAGEGESPSHEQAPRVCLSSRLENREHLVQVVEQLGGSVVAAEEASHFVGDALVVTHSLLVALCACQHVLSSAWLVASERAGRFVPETDYPMRDPKLEAELSINLQNTIRRAGAGRARIMTGLCVYISPAVPNASSMVSIVQAAGGRLVTSLPLLNQVLSGQAIIVSCKEDEQIWQPFAKRGARIYSRELIVSAALQQTLDFTNARHRIK